MDEKIKIEIDFDYDTLSRLLTHAYDNELSISDWLEQYLRGYFFAEESGFFEIDHPIEMKDGELRVDVSKSNGS